MPRLSYASGARTTVLHPVVPPTRGSNPGSRSDGNPAALPLTYNPHVNLFLAWGTSILPRLSYASGARTTVLHPVVPPTRGSNPGSRSDGNPDALPLSCDPPPPPLPPPHVKSILSRAAHLAADQHGVDIYTCIYNVCSLRHGRRPVSRDLATHLPGALRSSGALLASPLQGGEEMTNRAGGNRRRYI